MTQVGKDVLHQYDDFRSPVDLFFAGLVTFERLMKISLPHQPPHRNFQPRPQLIRQRNPVVIPHAELQILRPLPNRGDDAQVPVQSYCIVHAQSQPEGNAGVPFYPYV